MKSAWQISFSKENSVSDFAFEDKKTLDLLSIHSAILSNSNLKVPIAYRNFFLFKKAIRAPFIQRVNFPLDFPLDASILDVLQNSFRKGIFQSNIPIQGYHKLQEEVKPNFILHLNSAYESIFNNFKSDPRRVLRIIDKEKKFELKDIDFHTFDLFANQNINLQIPKSYRAISSFRILIEDTLANHKGLLKGVYFEESLVAVCFFKWVGDRLQFLLPVVNALGKKNYATSFLLHTIWQEYAKTNTVFDFSGSTMPSIAKFMKDFSPETEYYYSYSW